MADAIERASLTREVLIQTTVGNSDEVDFSAVSAAALCFPAARAGEVITVWVYDYKQAAYFATAITLVAAAYVKVHDDMFAADRIKFVTAGTAVTVTMHAKG